MLGRKSVLVASKSRCTTHHCYALYSAQACVGNKNLASKNGRRLKTVVQCVNYVRNSALRHHIFSEVCQETGSEFEVVLYHSNVRWLSRGQVLNRVFAMRVELAQFLQEHQHCHADCFKNPEFSLAYMADIFAALNHLNQQMQVVE
ncbi:hypothetical protein C0Q70_21615 [Pomacea canaliculata]|uniref:Uncharacterized protein n=1 Tax=Pomacea canaliculata TaxID=400727 RepID=A0A2T7ND05_POMCA|nr:hypothetical protein C0Q70_21615 [Pomacea canaliculata]